MQLIIMKGYIKIEGIELTSRAIEEIKSFQDDPSFINEEIISILDIIQTTVYMNGYEDCNEKLSKKDNRESMTLLYNIKDLLRSFIQTSLLSQ